MPAPRVTDIAWARDIRPVETKATSITVVAVDDWRKTVTAVPEKMPRRRFSVKVAMIWRRRAPATSCRLSRAWPMP